MTPRRCDPYFQRFDRRIIREIAAVRGSLRFRFATGKWNHASSVASPGPVIEGPEGNASISLARIETRSTLHPVPGNRPKETGSRVIKSISHPRTLRAAHHGGPLSLVASRFSFLTTSVSYRIPGNLSGTMESFVLYRSRGGDDAYRWDRVARWEEKASLFDYAVSWSSEGSMNIPRSRAANFLPKYPNVPNDNT